ncbi:MULTISPECIES: MarR family winged helix-turn-helix transcriptional regulator [unclassified Pseudomonas]|uniref:MarR family winged helix-turn-helix transcriptional regulator n=1 Tax=unclassified Pseudomonas TaxID=196821 RepID=UPI000270160F|nr:MULTISPECIES: MarR family transcriptional regulator [unclassified Pseudomonas]EJM06386.1 transcriptional regulator [Pseudomonas sp. GM16]EJM44341.1 transcriptional regulator [Pseudomonas sp. GM24]
MHTHLIDTFNILESVNKAMGQWIEEAVANQNITLMDFRILDSLAQGTALTTEQCSQHLNIISSKIAQSIDKLEKSGFVQRRREKPDRRKVMLQLTDQGLEIYELALGALYGRWQNSLNNIGADVLHITALFAGSDLAPIAKLGKKLLQKIVEHRL